MATPISNNLEKLLEKLASGDPAVVEGTVANLKASLDRAGAGEFRKTVEALCSLFYIDTADRPDLEAALDRASDVLALQGEKVVPFLLAQMQGSDIKSHMYLARALGRIGRDAIPRLREVLATAEDPYSRAFSLYALGKMTCPEVAEALPETIGGLMHPDKEVRDSAARTLGKIAQTVPPETLTPRRRKEMFESLMRTAHDPQAPVRAKAMRSLGKMASAGLLTPDEKEALCGAARAALGEAGEFVWDSAFIVRQEAREALKAAGSR